MKNPLLLASLMAIGGCHEDATNASSCKGGVYLLGPEIGHYSNAPCQNASVVIFEHGGRLYAVCNCELVDAMPSLDASVE